MLVRGAVQIASQAKDFQTNLGLKKESVFYVDFTSRVEATTFTAEVTTVEVKKFQVFVINCDRRWKFQKPLCSKSFLRKEILLFLDVLRT